MKNEKYTEKSFKYHGIDINLKGDPENTAYDFNYEPVSRELNPVHKNDMEPEQMLPASGPVLHSSKMEHMPQMMDMKKPKKPSY